MWGDTLAIGGLLFGILYRLYIHLVLYIARKKLINSNLVRSYLEKYYEEDREEIIAILKKHALFILYPYATKLFFSLLGFLAFSFILIALAFAMFKEFQNAFFLVIAALLVADGNMRIFPAFRFSKKMNAELAFERSVLDDFIEYMFKKKKQL